MMLTELPQTYQDVADWTWAEYAPYFQQLLDTPLSQERVESWLAEATHLLDLLSETEAHLQIALAQDTADPQRQQAVQRFTQDVRPHYQAAQQAISTKLIQSELQVPGYEVSMRSLLGAADLYREENLPLLAQERLLTNEYDQLIGQQTVEWDGEQLPMPLLMPKLEEPDRATRERAWRAMRHTALADREALAHLWQQLMEVRGQIASNADCKDYRAYAWRDRNRWDYTIEDAITFQQAVESAVVPAAQHLAEKRHKQLGVDSLRPWDLNVQVDSPSKAAAYASTEELLDKAGAIYRNLSPRFGDYIDLMRRENLFDLDARKGKAPGGFCSAFLAAKHPYIFMNATGTEMDITVFLHECGHAFHFLENMEVYKYFFENLLPVEFSEIPSTAMEYLAIPYLGKAEGGYLATVTLSRYVHQKIENAMYRWCYIAIGDAFQHWVYTHPEEACDATACDQQWRLLNARFMPWVDSSGVEEESAMQWMLQLHFFKLPFYFIEYGLSQLAAIQIWQQSLIDPQRAISQYIDGLAFTNQKTLPDLFATAGAKLAFDAETLAEAVLFLEQQYSRFEI